MTAEQTEVALPNGAACFLGAGPGYGGLSGLYGRRLAAVVAMLAKQALSLNEAPR